MNLCACHGRAETASVDRDRGAAADSLRRGERLAQSPDAALRDLVNRPVVVGVAREQHLLVLLLDLRLPERRAARVVHEHVVGGHVAQPLKDAPLGEVDLFPVARREARVEDSHEVERVTADVEAVSDGRRDPWPEAWGSARDLSREEVDVDACRRSGTGETPAGQRQDRPVVGERRGSGDIRICIGRGA